MPHYKYKELTTPGFNGSHYTFTKLSENDTSQFLGEYNNYSYIYAPKGYTPAKQHKEIDFQKLSGLTKEEKEALSKQATCLEKKLEVREQIFKEVGDTDDILANISKQVEFASWLSMILFKAQYDPTFELPEDKRLEYLARIDEVLTKEASGEILLRGTFDNPDTMLLESTKVTTQINKLVKPYKEEKDVLLNDK